MPAATKHPITPYNSSNAQAPSFWVMAHRLASLTERERMTRIGAGFEVTWLSAVKSALGLTTAAVASLANISGSTIERRIKNKSQLDPVTSERLDRLAQIAVLAEGVFGDEKTAGGWMSTPNDALGGATPFVLCKTELGARHVRRVLHAIEWGGVA